MNNFQSIIDLPIFKPTIENIMSSFNLVDTLIIQVKWFLLIELIRIYVIIQI